MIYVIDNGGFYSDHSIYFVESKLPRPSMEILLKLKDAGWCSAEYKILCIADTVEWFEGSPSKDVDFIYFSELFRYANYDYQEEELNDLVKGLPKWFVSNLVKKQEKELGAKSWGPKDSEQNKIARKSMETKIKLVKALCKIKE